MLDFSYLGIFFTLQAAEFECASEVIWKVIDGFLKIDVEFFDRIWTGEGNRLIYESKLHG
jgi:hypothetical protein